MAKNIEDKCQIIIVNFLKRLQQLEEFIYYSIPNGGHRNKAEASKLKMTGLIAGIPDLQFIKGSAGGSYKTFFIELKTSVGSLNDAQEIMIPKLESHGIKTYIIYGDTPQEVLPQVMKALSIEFGFNQNGMSSISAKVLEASFTKLLFKASKS